MDEDNYSGAESIDSPELTQALTPSPTPAVGDIQHVESEAGLEDSNEIDVDEEARKQDAYLVDSALHVLFGLRERHKGLKTTKFDELPSVIDIAPAVWNANYLKVRFLVGLRITPQTTNTNIRQQTRMPEAFQLLSTF